jgi:hypothetical protein
MAAQASPLTALAITQEAWGGTCCAATTFGVSRLFTEMRPGLTTLGIVWRSCEIAFGSRFELTLSTRCGLCRFDFGGPVSVMKLHFPVSEMHRIKSAGWERRGKIARTVYHPATDDKNQHSTVKSVVLFHRAIM